MRWVVILDCYRVHTAYTKTVGRSPSSPPFARPLSSAQHRSIANRMCSSQRSSLLIHCPQLCLT